MTTSTDRTVDPAADPCACDDFRVSRRQFVGGTMATAAGAVVATAFGAAHSQVALGAASPAGNVMVVLSLRGGADGLSLVVPYGDDDYYRARPTIGIPAEQVVAKDQGFGLHPGFKPLLPLWNSGRLSAVHAVGMPSPNRSHFSAMEAVEDADPGSAERRGWINRLVGLDGTSDPIHGAQIGGGTVPGSLYGSTPVVGLRDLGDLVLPGNPREVSQNRAALRRLWGGAPGAMGQGARSTLEVTGRLRKLGLEPVKPRNGASYPRSDLGEALKNAAKMIRSRVGARIITIDSGSWDHHSRLGTVVHGPLRLLVDDLAKSLAAFFTDLGPEADRVTVATISEFGRRVEENSSRGLDHGYGNSMFLLGAGVRGGQYHGRFPGLRDSSLVEGDLAVRLDHRSVLAEVLRARMPEVSIPQVFPGFTPETVGAMRP